VTNVWEKIILAPQNSMSFYYFNLLKNWMSIHIIVDFKNIYKKHFINFGKLKNEREVEEMRLRNG